MLVQAVLTHWLLNEDVCPCVCVCVCVCVIFILQLIGIFYKLRSKLQYVCLRNIYYAFVHPYLMYGIEIYANTYIIYVDKLVKRIINYLEYCKFSLLLPRCLNFIPVLIYFQ